MSTAGLLESLRAWARLCDERLSSEPCALGEGEVLGLANDLAAACADVRVLCEQRDTLAMALTNILATVHRIDGYRYDDRCRDVSDIARRALAPPPTSETDPSGPPMRSDET